jgi:hypothetical protein
LGQTCATSTQCIFDSWYMHPSAQLIPGIC